MDTQLIARTDIPLSVHSLTNRVVDGASSVRATEWYLSGDTNRTGLGSATDMFILTNAADISFQWTNQFWLGVNTTNGSVTPTTGWYDEGTQLLLQATPDDGYFLNEWQGDRVSESNPLPLHLTQPRNRESTI